MTPSKKTSKTAPRKGSQKRAYRTLDQRIQDMERKLRKLRDRKAVSAVSNEPVFKHLKAARTALAKAVQQLDGRKSKLSSDFIRASRQYLNLLERALDEAVGRKRRGRKPRMDLEA